MRLQTKILAGYLVLVAVICSMAAILVHERGRMREIEAETGYVRHTTSSWQRSFRSVRHKALQDTGTHHSVYVRKALAFVRKMLKHISMPHSQVPPLNPQSKSDNHHRMAQPSTVLRWTGKASDLAFMLLYTLVIDALVRRRVAARLMEKKQENGN